VKAPEVRRLSLNHDAAALQAAADAILAGQAPAIEVQGDAEEGEHLTHALLALRVRKLVDAGAAHKDAFREVMTAVRGVLTDD